MAEYIFLDTNKMIGQNLTYWINELKINREDLVKESGISAVYISEIENFKRDPGYNTLCKLAKGMGIKVAQLTDNSVYINEKIVQDKEIRYLKGGNAK